MIEVLSEKQARANPHAILRCWEAGNPFAVLPEPCSVSAEWVQQQLLYNRASLPSDAYCLLTSGTTGKPKLVVGSRARTERLLEEIHIAQGLESSDCTIVLLPLSYSYAFVNQWLWSVKFGRRAVITAGMADPQCLMESLKMAQRGMICLVGALVPVLRKLTGSDVSLPGISTVNFAGGVFPQAELPWLSTIFPKASFFHNYGCTEAMPRLTVRPASVMDDPMVLGAPLKDIELKIKEDGELVFRSPYSACGVIDECGYRRFEDSEWIGTGDLAEVVSEGRFRLVGRLLEVFKRFGEKLSLPEVAAVIRRICQIEVWLYTETSANGEIGYVVVLESERLRPEVVSKLLLMFRQNYRRALWPDRIETVGMVPLSANGKVDVVALRNSDRNVIWRQRI